ncbi:MAG: hypothetical protein ACXQTX_02395 [Candidatus Syntropharchaeia archaeon]
MKIKELEYSELKTKAYNNYRVSARAELDPNENETTALNSLKEFVRSELAKAVAERDSLGQYYNKEIETLRGQRDILKEHKDTLIEEIISRIRARMNEIWR